MSPKGFKNLSFDLRSRKRLRGKVDWKALQKARRQKKGRSYPFFPKAKEEEDEDRK